jgi:hypothetical protein
MNSVHRAVDKVPLRGDMEPLVSQRGPKPICALVFEISDFTALAIKDN